MVCCGVSQLRTRKDWWSLQNEPTSGTRKVQICMRLLCPSGPLVSKHQRLENGVLINSSDADAGCRKERREVFFTGARRRSSSSAVWHRAVENLSGLETDRVRFSESTRRHDHQGRHRRKGAAFIRYAVICDCV